MKIGFFEVEGWEEELVRAAFPDHDVFLSHEKITETALPTKRDFEILSTFVDSRFDDATLAAFPNLKCLTTRSTGYDHIDIAGAAKRGITVCSVPGYGDNTVAEFTFGLLLNLTRKIYHGIDQIKEIGSFAIQTLRGHDIKGKTLGVIGTGRIGREVIAIAKGFGMNVIASDPHPNMEYAKEMGYEYKSLDELLKESDVITIHCPYNKNTHHLLNSKNLMTAKRGAYLVNTARGAIIETEALLMALKEGVLAGAALDVLEEEGDVKDEMYLMTMGNPKEHDLKIMLEDQMLMHMPNVLITPHNAFNSQEALERILATTIENIKQFIAGTPINIAK